MMNPFFIIGNTLTGYSFCSAPTISGDNAENTDNFILSRTSDTKIE